MIRKNKSIIGGLTIAERPWIDEDQSSVNEIITNISNVNRGKTLISALTNTITFIAALTVTDEQESIVF